MKAVDKPRRVAGAEVALVAAVASGAEVVPAVAVDLGTGVPEPGRLDQEDWP